MVGCHFCVGSFQWGGLIWGVPFFIWMFQGGTAARLGDMSPWLVLYALAGTILLSWIGIGFICSLALFVAGGFAAWRIGMKLGQDQNLVWTWIIPLVWMIIMAGKKNPWNINIPPAPWAGNAILADNTVWEGVPVQTPLPEVVVEAEVTEFDTGYGA